MTEQRRMIGALASLLSHDGPDLPWMNEVQAALAANKASFTPGGLSAYAPKTPEEALREAFEEDWLDGWELTRILRQFWEGDSRLYTKLDEKDFRKMLAAGELCRLNVHRVVTSNVHLDLYEPFENGEPDVNLPRPLSVPFMTVPLNVRLPAGIKGTIPQQLAALLRNMSSGLAYEAPRVVASSLPYGSSLAKTWSVTPPEVVAERRGFSLNFFAYVHVVSAP